MLIIGPKVVSVVDGNETTGLTASDLQEMGFDVVFYAVAPFSPPSRRWAIRWRS